MNEAAGVTYLPELDHLFVKLFNGDGADLDVLEFTSSGRVVGLLVEHATRRLPAELLPPKP